MESSTNSAPAPIDLSLLMARFLKSLKRTWLLVLVLCMLMAGGNLLLARIRYTPVYRCQAIFSIDSGYSNSSIFSGGSLYYDSATVEALAEAFPELLKTDYMREMIRHKLGSSQINGSISAFAIEGTNLMELTVTSSSAQDAYDILNAVVEAYPMAAEYMADNPEIYLMDTPIVPTKPVNSFSTGSALIRGGLIGLVIGLAITAVLAMLNRTVGSASELKKIINLPILATFPLANQKKRRKKANQAFVNAMDHDQMSEALRGLRTKIRKALADKGGKVILLTSTIPGEGKTTISTNLALSLANEGHRVVLVDADLRNQSIARLFRVSQNARGLMDCMKNPHLSALECLTQASDNLFFISGSSTNKRHYGIDGKVLRRILDTLEKHFDYIIVDTPPCSVVSDTALLGRLADCVLYVVKMDYANQSQIQDGVTGLYQKDIPLTGCVINGAAQSSHGYGYGYGYGYGSYGYGKKYGYGQSKQS